ncbi:MAG: CHC2 zinc finger domain-containing protein [Chthoniobacteraceae bacterium]
MPFFDKDFILRVLDSTDLVALVRGYVKLDRKGDRWVGLCPFHDEKTPSFGVREKGEGRARIWKCFGCGAGGDALRFLRQIENISFPEATRRLAAKAGLELPTSQKPGEWKPNRQRRTSGEFEEEIKARKARGLHVRASHALQQIVKQWEWSEADMFHAAEPLPDTPLEEARALLRLFKPADIVWCGRFTDSIGVEDVKRTRPERIAHVQACFRTAEEWLQHAELPGPRICPCAMKPGVLARSDASIRARRFLVVEHDALPLEEQGAVLRWLREAGGLKLRAVLFTGSKSLHGWFEAPPGEAMAEAETILCGMGYDRASFVPSQPFRLPGWKHNKTQQAARLLFLS